MAPYIEIFKRTVDEVKRSFSQKEPRIARIASNEEICRKVAEKLQANRQLTNMIFHLRSSCAGCEYNDPSCCRLQEILVGEWDILGLTYAKLKALSISQSATTIDLLEKIKFPDNLILDEFVTGIVTTFPSFEIEQPYAYLQRELDYESRMLRKKKHAFEDVFWPAIGNLALMAETKGENLSEGGKAVFDSPIKDDVETFFEDNFAKCWNLVEHLIIEEKKTKVLQQLLEIANADKFFIMKKKGKISIKPVLDINDISRGSVYVKNFVQDFFSRGKLVALVDACLPDLNLSASLGLNVETYPWRDPLNTNRSQLIVCDTKKIGSIDFFRDVALQKELKDTIHSLSEHHGTRNVMVVSQDKDLWNVLKLWQKNGEIAPDLLMTYYRSDISRGVRIEGERRILILVGGPYIPKEAYLPETYVKTGQAKDLQTAFRKSDMKSAFINMIGRVKDPAGQEKSIVYAAGITAREVRAFVEQEGIQSPPIFQFLFTGADVRDFALAGSLFLYSDELTDKWNDLEKDLPVLVRILQVCRYKDEPLTPSDIASGHTQRVTQFIESYPDVLKKLSIEVIKKGKSIRLQTL